MLCILSRDIGTAPMIQFTSVIFASLIYDSRVATHPSNALFEQVPSSDSAALRQREDNSHSGTVRSPVSRG